MSCLARPVGWCAKVLVACQAGTVVVRVGLAVGDRHTLRTKWVIQILESLFSCVPGLNNTPLADLAASAGSIKHVAVLARLAAAPILIL